MEIQLANRGMQLPAPRIAISIRQGELRDLPFIDALQHLHTKQVGFLPTKALEGKIRLGHILIAENAISPQRHGGTEKEQDEFLPSSVSPFLRGEPLGYLIGNDQYFKRDDLGAIFQLNVLPGKQRGLIGASLLKAQFERSAYGCKLYCCWCAQDLEANRFWEACGFVPLAFRTGSRTKGRNAAGKGVPRVHIFWQKRIREGDVTTPWWFPSQTSSGAIREDRLVLPIPHGVKWCDPMPVILPVEDPVVDPEQRRRERAERACLERSREVEGLKKLPGTKSAATVAASPAPSKQLMGSGFISFAPLAQAKPKKALWIKEPKTKQKNDPKYIAAARELRDRWLERVNDDPMMLASDGKYDVARAPVLSAVEGIAGPTAMINPSLPLPEAA